MTIITSEIRQAIKQAGDRHLEMFDPVTNKTYFLVTSEWLEDIKAWLTPWEDEGGRDYDDYEARLLDQVGESEPNSTGSRRDAQGDTA